MEDSKLFKSVLVYLLEVLDLFSEAVKIEIISDVLLVYFGEKFMSLEVAKPLNPAVAGLTVVVIIKVLVYISCNCRVRLAHIGVYASGIHETNLPRQ